MLTLQDCIGFSGLTPEQLEAVADHEHLDMIIAAEWAETMLDKPNGADIVEHVLSDEVDYCETHGNRSRHDRYQACLDEFHKQHPMK